MLIATSLIAQFAFGLASPPATPAIHAKTAPEGRAAWTAAPEVLSAELAEAGQSLTLTAFPLSDGSLVELQLVRAEGFTADARLVLMQRDARGTLVEQNLPRPELDCFSGQIANDPQSRVFIGSGACGTHGYIQSLGKTHVISSGPFGAGLPIVVSDAATLPFDPSAFSCGADSLEQPEPSDGGLAGAAGAPCRQARLAIDTDNEFLSVTFANNSAAASAYAGLLFTAIREICSVDLNLRPAISYLRLWQTEDPWVGTDMCGQLGDFRNYWEANEGGVSRHSAHLLNGRGLGGGCAWLNAMCVNYSYACSANLGGSFPYPVLDHDHANWDLMVVAHEFGHNLGAPHTHDQVGSPEYCGDNDCTNAWAGTIMSYCHGCPGGLSNVSMTYAQVSIDSILSYLPTAPCDMTTASEGPVAVADWSSTGTGTSVEIDLLANDNQANCAEIELISAGPSQAGGVVTILPSGLVRYTPPPAAVQITDYFPYVIYNGAAGYGFGDVTVQVLPLHPGSPVAGSEPGLRAEYYALSSPSVLPDFTSLQSYANEIVPDVNYASTNGVFAGSGLADGIGAVFEGWLVVPAGGLWTLYTNSDDGSRLKVDGYFVVENDGLHGMWERSGAIGLASGFHSVRIEFFENGGGAGCIASIAGPGMAKQPIPASMLRNGGIFVDADLNDDGEVSGADLALLLGYWGTSGPLGDLDADGSVGGSDMSLLLSSWTIGS